MTQDTLFKKNRLLGDFRALKPSIVVGLWVALVMIGLFLFCSEVLGAPIFEDDFESYTTGQDLGAQVDWLCNFSSGNQPTISEDRAESGIKSVRNKYVNNPAFSTCLSDHDDVDEGSQQAWFYITDEFTGWVALETEHNEIGMKFEDDLIKYVNSQLQWVTLTTFDEYDEWVSFAYKWRYDTEIRYSYNGGDWTDWEDIGTGLQFTRIMVNWSTQQATGTLYWDTLEEAPPPCEIGTCFACGTYEDCMEAGCYWYYSIYGTGGLWGSPGSMRISYCLEPYDPDPEECGSFYKCQYCSTQETCEAELCVWEDRFGLGEKCYMLEPVIPPPQVEWEVPDLEECGGLSGVEKWLCEIKNFIAGIFMPTQAKVNSLYHTIGAFKEKFPFNYANTLNRFFDDIGESVDEEKGIPIKILGEESNVSFAFWDTTTTIGGEEETFKNIWFDFTSVIILMGWFVWLISWIRRFF